MSAIKKMKKILWIIGHDSQQNDNFKHFHFLKEKMNFRVSVARRASKDLKNDFKEYLKFAIVQSQKDGLLTVEEIKNTFEGIL